MNICTIKNICGINKPRLLGKCSLVLIRHFSVFICYYKKTKSKLSNCDIESSCLLERKARFGCGMPCLKYCMLCCSAVTSFDFLSPVFLPSYSPLHPGIHNFFLSCAMLGVDSYESEHKCILKSDWNCRFLYYKLVIAEHL